MSETPNYKYCNSLTEYSRFKTLEVRIGDLPMGASNPIRIQSMTTTDTLNTIATVEQSIRMIKAGCDYVRITAPSLKEAQNLAEIKKELRKRGYSNPLIADIHYTPNAAELAARLVEKVRINPGNYADKKKFEVHRYTASAYQAELDRIRERFVPLVKVCKEYGTAMRIGTNHGSLSDRILSRYGDTPEGMVESAFEFLSICEDLNYHNIVLSMKASNTLVMVQAYRLLVNKMIASQRNYPLHLGVTEAGEGEDGRIKSAVGIGTLLEDGLGDTIRVSLTEEPEFEIPVAKLLIEKYTLSSSSGNSTIQQHNPFEYSRRSTAETGSLGGSNVPRVVADFSTRAGELKPANFFSVGYSYSAATDKWTISDQACDYIYLGDKTAGFAIPGTLGLIYKYKTWLKLKTNPRSYPLFSLEEFVSSKEHSGQLNFIRISPEETGETIKALSKPDLKADSSTLVLVIDATSLSRQRQALFELENLKCKLPVIFKQSYSQLDDEKFRLRASADCGGLFIDGFGDGLWLSSDNAPALVNSTAFGILQATRTRISKTEYISCPSCGRTLFDLQETTQKIRKRTGHLKGIKIGIMGCIVNGPGEMADADYGYVGTGIGKITLYKGKEVVKRNVNSDNAVEALIQLIKNNGDWIEKEI